nr:AbrB family transcriptional regulator [Corynebacterium uropygiale]
MLAGIIGSGVVALVRRQQLRVTTWYSSLCRGFIGVLAAAPLLTAQVRELAPLLLPSVACGLLILGFSIGAAYLLFRWSRSLSPTTSVISMLPGGASYMATMAMELGVNHRLTTLSQFLRVLIVSMSLPIVVGIARPQSPAAAAAAAPQLNLASVLLIIAIALAGGPLARKLHIPAPSVFGPLLLTVLAGAILPDYFTLQPPVYLRDAALLTVGWLCGGAISVADLKLFAKLLAPLLLFTVLLMAFCAGLALAVSALLHVGYIDAYLATTPGAIDTVMALSSQYHIGPIVVAFQLVRLIFILLFVAFLGGHRSIVERWAH